MASRRSEQSPSRLFGDSQSEMELESPPLNLTLRLEKENAELKLRLEHMIRLQKGMKGGMEGDTGPPQKKRKRQSSSADENFSSTASSFSTASCYSKPLPEPQSYQQRLERELKTLRAGLQRLEEELRNLQLEAKRKEEGDIGRTEEESMSFSEDLHEGHSIDRESHYGADNVVDAMDVDFDLDKSGPGSVERMTPSLC